MARLSLIAGRLVVLHRIVRDIHRFGFDSLADLAAEADAMISEALGMLERYPEVAGL